VGLGGNRSFKWGISLANIADYNRPPELISVPQQFGECWCLVCSAHSFSLRPDATVMSAVTATGLIWSRYSFVITPVNYNLFSVNAFMAVTGGYQLWRRFQWQQQQAKA
jgi:hypothetical protein